MLAEPERIDSELHQIISMVVEDWGVTVLRAEIKNIDLPGGEQVDYAALRRQQSGKGNAPLRDFTEVVTDRLGSSPAVARNMEDSAKEEVQEPARRGREPRVFLCYRREDAQGFARGIFEILSAKYGHKRVFRDVDSIPAGMRYSNLIKSVVAQCNVMVVLIGHAWSSAKDEDGRRRLELPNDLVREEIEEGLRLEVPIIPVCVQGARMPSEAELPRSIADLAGFQSTEVTDVRWDFDVRKLLNAIDDLVASADER